MLKTCQAKSTKMCFWRVPKNIPCLIFTLKSWKIILIMDTMGKWTLSWIFEEKRTHYSKPPFWVQKFTSFYNQLIFAKLGSHLVKSSVEIEFLDKKLWFRIVCNNGKKNFCFFALAHFCSMGDHIVLLRKCVMTTRLLQNSHLKYTQLSHEEV